MHQDMTGPALLTQLVDLVDEGFDGRIAADAEADDGEVNYDEAVEGQHRGPAAGPPAFVQRSQQCYPD